MYSWIKIDRGVRNKAFYSKDSEKVHLWIHLLICANFSDHEEMLGGKPVLCKPGQFTTGRKQLSMQTGISESKIERILTYFEKIEQQIEQQKTNTNRLISILNWDKYQQVEQQTEQQVNNDRTTSEQRVNTLKEYKELEEDEELKKNILKKTSDEVLEKRLRVKIFLLKHFVSDYVTEKAIDTIISLEKKYTSFEIEKAIVYGRTDDFWKSNFLSPNKLNQKDKSGVKYMDLFLEKSKFLNNGTGKPKFTNTANRIDEPAFLQDIARRLHAE